MTRNWKLFAVTSIAAILGATAIAFASDILSTHITPVVNTGVMSLARATDDCPPNACSIVFKADSSNDTSTIIDVRQ